MLGNDISFPTEVVDLAVLNDRSIDAQSRAIIRYALEINDPWLARLVRRAKAGETVVDTINVSETPKMSAASSSEEKIGPLTEMICSGGEESAAALLVLMATIEDSTDPKALAHAAKHLAFTRCGELNAYGIVDITICDILQSEILQRVYCRAAVRRHPQVSEAQNHFLAPAPT